ncbi:MAG: Rpn family recombination-promoting nuclease/putative transposase [Candidatus Riflebacteria bacterium]|nr:Rpn family recombination-promoting nuclease/putative transposase [Candidatus Riflebacteria bacterium]
MADRDLITFDWAIKRLLRSKANFGILEGFLSELLHEDIKIIEVLESESNRDTEKNKLNQIDLKVKNDRNEIIIVEVQYEREADFFHRLLFGSSKVITEHLEKGEDYSKIVKVYSISVLFFELGHGDDYIYHGTTVFRGIHLNDTLELSEKQRGLFNKKLPGQIYPEYYLIRVNNFNDTALTSLDEWVYFLKNSEIKTTFTAKGLQLAKLELNVMKLSEPERISYEIYQKNLHYEASMMRNSFREGKLEGKLEGKKEGEKEAKVDIIRKLISLKFGQIDEKYIEKINNSTAGSIEKYIEKILFVSKIEDLFT